MDAVRSFSGETAVSPGIHFLESDLAVSGVAKTFDGEVAVLRDVGFSVRKGEAVSLIGANGTGKSTLMRACLGLIGVDRGSIRILGEEITGLGGKALQAVRGRVGFVFQRHNLGPRLSALSNVVHGAQAHSKGPHLWHQALAPRTVREEAMHCLDLVGLANFALRRVDRLSGGQSQRVAIARALMQRPKMVLADEPVASLDPNAGEKVMSLFVDLMRREGLTLFYSSHNLEHALAYSDRVIGLRGGGVAFDAHSPSLRADGLRQIHE